ncbi:MAG: HIT domain-containing protein [Candidatus Aminicenantes bacterium]|nr:HIT domain-containing protein [Candidatus Aminicenantes bacterium]
MEYITVPWRKDYVKNAQKMKQCFFCVASKRNHDQKDFILFRGNHNFVILNKYPYSPGHLMIAPFNHLDSIEKAEKKASDEMADILKKSIEILRKVYHPHGFNTGMNIGHSAGAGVAYHYHMHIIPRWTGDSNFMPLVARAKLTIEDIRQTYDKLSRHFKDVVL